MIVTGTTNAAGTTITWHRAVAVNIPDDFDVPGAYYPDEVPGNFQPPTPPPGFAWWRGWWPTYGLNSPDDLKLYVEVELDQMISRQDGPLAEFGFALGVQALKNADRYLGQFGKGDHPPRPPADQLQRVEEVEDALEAVLRYLRQQGQPAAAPPVPSAAPSAGVKGKYPAPRSWTQGQLDAAIHQYAAQRAGALKSLRDAVQAGSKGAVRSAQKMFGRNEIARALGVKAPAMVTDSTAWHEIADDLRLSRRRDGYRGLKRTDKIGFDKAVEDKAEAEGDTVAVAVEAHETIEYIDGEVTEKAAIAHVRKHLSGYEADALIAGIQSGEVPTERVAGMVKVLLEDRDDTRRRRR